MNKWASDARRFVRRSEHGVLATVSARLGGYPFGSVVSYVPDVFACPVVLISRLAEHTANLQADARCSLLVQQSASDPQASARVTLVCDAHALEADAQIVERHVKY